MSEVIDHSLNTVTPVSAVTNKAGQPIKVGREPMAVAVTPDGKTAYVVNNGDGTVTPVSIVTARPARRSAPAPTPSP
jgi:DNA-binding beta-propeller fold protein YncE